MSVRMDLWIYEISNNAGTPGEQQFDYFIKVLANALHGFGSPLRTLSTHPCLHKRNAFRYSKRSPYLISPEIYRVWIYYQSIRQKNKEYGREREDFMANVTAQTINFEIRPCRRWTQSFPSHPETRIMCTLLCSVIFLFFCLIEQKNQWKLKCYEYDWK